MAFGFGRKTKKVFKRVEKGVKKMIKPPAPNIPDAPQEAHTPVEAPESGRSKQFVRILEIVSEGEVEGLVYGKQSVFLDNTPLQNADGSFNFQNADVDGEVGTQDQEIMTDFNTTEKEISVGTDIRKRTPLTRTVTDPNVTRLRLTLGVSSLFEQAENGDTNGSQVDFVIRIGSQTHNLSINGKYSSQYLRSVIIDQLPPVPFQIRVERVQADSTSQRLQNKTLWASYTEIIDTQFAYPNTALMGVKFDSEYFSQIPTRSYDLYGIKVQVPSNYDPATRTYNGLWDGTFKRVYSNNPAWVLMDIVTNKRYGLGRRLGEFGVDKWALYQVAQYCDQKIPDGFGGTEPRFTCNVWLTEQRAAYDVINDICSIFRAMPVWNGTELTVIMDRPSDPVWTYTNANVIGGEFSRQYSAVKSRHNAIQVEYQDASNNYEKAIEYVSDDDAIRKYGLNLKKVVAFGCTSRGQAYRTGRWILETERLETETITFSVGAEGLMHLPGDIIRVSDNHYAGTEIGGRVVAISGRTVTLDREIQLHGNSVFSFINAQAKHSYIRIHSVQGKTITLDRTPTGLSENGVWSLSTQQITSRLYRAMSIAENEDGSYTITALQHEPQKEAIVDNGAVFEPVATTLHRVPRLEHLDVSLVGGNVSFNWQSTTGEGTVYYDVRVLKGENLYAFHKGLTSLALALEDLPDGDYTVIIIAKNARGQILSEKRKTFTVNRPPVPQNVRVVGGLSEISLSWDYVDDLTQTEIWASDRNEIRTAKRVAKVLASFYSHTVGARQTRYYWLRHTRGQNRGAFSQQAGIQAQSGADIDEEIRLLNEKLSQPIINQVFDVAAPARKLEMVKVVANLTNKNAFLGHTLIKNEADGRLYKWNGRSYTFNTPSSEIDGQILPTQLAEIPTNKLSGQLSDAQIREIRAAKIAGQLGDHQIQAISVRKLQGEILPTQLAKIPTTKLSGRLSAEQIEANAIGANHIAAGVLTADKFAVGLGGNLLINPIFANVQSDGLPHSYGKWTSDTARNFRAMTGQETDTWGLKHYLPNENQLIARIDGDSRASATVSSEYVPINAGHWYMLSAFMGIHRGIAKLTARCVKADGTYQDFTSEVIPDQFSFNGGLASSLTKRAFVKFRAPPNTVKMCVLFWIIAKDNQSNKQVRVARPMLEECTEHTREPSPWQNAGVTAIHGGSIITDTVDADKLRANAVTAVKIASNAITTEKLSASAVLARHIATGAIVSEKIAANAITAEKIAANAVNAGKIAANSIAANHLQANVITAGKIASNAVQTAHIQSGAIRTDHLAAGQISADKLAIGLGGNLLINPIFANVGSNGLPSGCGRWLDSNASNFRSSTGQLTDIWGLKSYLPNENQLVVSIDGNNQASATVSMQDVPVNEGAWYLLSAYIGVHRCHSRITARCIKADGSRQDFNSDIVDTRFSFNGGLAGYAKRAFVKFRVPAGTVKMTVLFWILPIGNEANKHLRVARPMLEECTEHTREPSPWQNAGVTSIHGGSIVTDSITAQQIAAGTITGNELVAGTISSRHIATNTIGASHIQSGSIDAAKIRAGAISANQIASNAIEAKHIKAGSIGAEKLNVNTLSAVSSDLGTVTAGTISGTTINGATIKGGTISGVHISGVTGRFTGELEITKLIGTGAFEHILVDLKKTGTKVKYYEEEYDVTNAHGDTGPRIRSIPYTVNVYEASILIEHQPFERYISIQGQESFVLPAYEVKEVDIKRESTLYRDEPVEGTKVLVTSYSTTNAHTISVHYR